jgi:tetratricopeptide (TPR) repeat protein
MMKPLSEAILAILLCFFLSFPVAAEEKGRAYYDFGVFAFEDGDYDDALGNLQKALELNPDYPLYLHYLGKIHLKLDQFEAAEQNLAAAYQADPEIAGLVYDLAMLHYRKEEFSKAAELFQSVADQEPENVLAFYFAGLSFYKTKKYSQAVEYLLKASEASSSIKTNGYYYAGISQFHLCDFDQATELLSYVVENADSEALRENARKWMKSVEKRQKALKPFTLLGRISRRYDDNVVLEPIDQDIYANEDDWLSTIYLAGKYKFFKRHDLEAGAGYSHYQTLYDDLSEYNLTGSTLQFYVRYNVKPYLFDFSYFPSFYWLDNDGYLLRHRINPRVIWQVDDKTSFSLSYAFMTNNHLQDADRLGHANEVSLDGYRLVQSIKGNIAASISYEDDSTRHRDRAFGRLVTRVSLSAPISYELMLVLSGRFEDKSYKYVDSFYNERRQDTKHQATVSLSRKFYDDIVEVSADFSYSRNNSNISDYEYRRRVFSLTVSARF